MVSKVGNNHAIFFGSFSDLTANREQSSLSTAGNMIKKGISFHAFVVEVMKTRTVKFTIPTSTVNSDRGVYEGGSYAFVRVTLSETAPTRRPNNVAIDCYTIKHHNRAICPQRKLKKKAKLQAVSIVSEPQQLHESNVLTQALATGQSVLLQTANAVIHNARGSTSKRARILLDSASQRTFITEKLAKTPGLKNKEAKPW